MTANPHRGETTLRMNGHDHLLVYDWEALARLQTLLGPDFEKKIAEATTTLDVQTLANILSVGLQRHNPVAAQDIMAMSPPLVAVSRAIVTALNRAFYGMEQPEQTEDGPDQPEPNPTGTSSQTDGGPASAPA